MNPHWGCGIAITELKAANKGLRKAEEDHQKSRQDMYDEFLAQADENHQQQIRLEKSVKQMNRIAEAAQSENDKLQKEINKLRKQRDLKEWHRVAASHTARDHLAHIQTLERQSVEKDACIDQLTRELQRESWRKHEAQRQVATYQQELEEREVADPGEIATMHATIDDYEIKTLCHQDELQERESTIQNLEAKVAELNAKLEQRGREKAESIAAVRIVFRHQGRVISTLKEEKEKLEAVLQNQNEDWKELARVFNELKQGLDALCKDS
jgi:chromosome segregation ATPase